MCVQQLSCKFDNVSSSYVKVCYQLFLAADSTSGVKIKFFLNAPGRLPIDAVSTLEHMDDKFCVGLLVRPELIPDISHQEYFYSLLDEIPVYRRAGHNVVTLGRVRSWTAISSLALSILEQRLGWRLIVNISLVIKFSFTGLVNIFPNQTLRRKCQWTFLFQCTLERTMVRHALSKPKT